MSEWDMVLVPESSQLRTLIVGMRTEKLDGFPPICPSSVLGRAGALMLRLWGRLILG